MKSERALPSASPTPQGRRRRPTGAGRLPTTAVVALPLMLLLAFSPPLGAQTFYDYNIHQPTQDLMARGAQALLICNGVFVSDRTLDEIYHLELQQRWTTGTVPRSAVEIDHHRKAVTVGAGNRGNDPIPAMRSAYREGLGCVAMAPDQSYDDIDALPRSGPAPPEEDPSTVPWPDGEWTRGCSSWMLRSPSSGSPTS